MCLGYATISACVLAIACLWSIELAVIAVQRVINKGVGKSNAAIWAAPQSELLSVCIDMERLFHDLLPQVLFATTIVPLFAMEDVIINGSEADGFSLSIIPAIIVGLIPVCEFSDAVLQGRNSLQSAVYFGPWLEEPVSTQRHMLCFAFASFSRRGFVSGPLVKAFCRRTLGKVLIQWFKFLQALLNIQNHKTGRI
ncbi:uncharacterized protein LOC127750107 [Frankliniella occidentalis]|uniref:Uncharacterized protein LOC127750107 n=1 Tax=Frankliniella occidentalis TaxID=133901 RepID=A0A9C6U3B5_FRAOC|nr:uncharacterized protein LOC127750107 [Frankliniella occidentalis]